MCIKHDIKYIRLQSAIHAKRTYRELRMLKHMRHENVSFPQFPSPFIMIIITLVIIEITIFTTLQKQKWKTLFV